MAKATLTTTVAALLATGWTSTPILDPNDDMRTPDTGGWVELQFPLAADNQKANLSGRYVEESSFRIVVATEIMGGRAAAMTACETIAAIFRDKFLSGVKYWVPTIREPTDDGSYYVGAVIVPYTYHYTD